MTLSATGLYRRHVCQGLGARYDGESEGLVWLTDSQTGSSGVIPVPDFSALAVEAKLQEIRAKFAEATK